MKGVRRFEKDTLTRHCCFDSLQLLLWRNVERLFAHEACDLAQ